MRARVVASDRLVPRRVSVLTLACTIFFVVSGGPYSAEVVVGKTGPLFGIALLLVCAVFWALPVALLTAEMSSIFPEEGGYYVWVKSALGPFPAFLCGWWSWLSSWVDVALYPVLAASYAAKLLPHDVNPLVVQAIKYGIIVVFAAVNLRGIRSVGFFSDGLTLALLAPFAVLIGVALFRAVSGQAPHLPWLNGPPKASEIGAAAVFALWNFFGWDSVTMASAEIQAAGQRLPKALMIGLVLVTASVVLPVAAGVVVNTNWTQWNTQDGYWPEIAARAFPWLGIAAALAGVISGIGLFSANLLASSRIPYVLAADGFLPKLLYREHPKYKTPWVGILVAAALAAVLAQESFENLVAIDLSLYLAALLLEFASLLALRAKQADADAGFRIPGGMAAALAVCAIPALIAALAVVLQLSPALRTSLSMNTLRFNPIGMTLAMLLSGPAVYGAIHVARHGRLTEHDGRAH